ncbi:MAG: hypothetical protein AB1473_22290 [Thermodesulfobacteriota bacterium]
MMKKQTCALKTEATELPDAGNEITSPDGGISVGTQAQEESYLEDRFTLVALNHLIKEAAD